MFNVAVHVHVFYIKSWNYIREKIRNMLCNKNCNFKIIITVDESIPLKNLQEIEQFKHPCVSVVKVPNKGYDIGPFFCFLKLIDLAHFDFVVKLHSKSIKWGINQDLKNGYFISRMKWRRYLLDAIARSPAFFQSNLEQFERDPELGMVGSKYLIVNYTDEKCGDEEYLRSLCDKTKLEFSNSFSYIAGTMFIVRASLLLPLEKFHILDEEFENSTVNKFGGTKAHVMERFFGLLIERQGKSIKGFDGTLMNNISTCYLAHVFHKFIINKRITANNRLLIRVLGIPVYNKKINKN